MRGKGGKTVGTMESNGWKEQGRLAIIRGRVGQVERGVA